MSTPKTTSETAGIRRRVRRSGSQCLVCGSRKSIYRIHTENLGYDETACRHHMRELEEHADETLGVGTVPRWHITASAGVRRDGLRHYQTNNTKNIQ
jgi:hypothetical protein